MAWSEPSVPQPLGKLTAIARTTSRRLQHSPPNVIGSLRSFEALQHPTEPLAGTAERQQEQEQDGDDQAQPQRDARDAAEPESGEKTGDHRRPRFQSSRRA